MNLVGFGLTALLTFCLSGLLGPPLHGCATRAHRDRPPRVVVATAGDDDALRVCTRHGHTHVRLGGSRHGLEVTSDERGNTRVEMGGTLSVRTDERGGAQVHLGGVTVDTDDSD